MTEQEAIRVCRYHYSDPERVKIADDLAAAILERDKAARDFGVAKKAYDEAQNKRECHIRALSRQLCDGWELRDMACKVLLDSPKSGEKTVIRIDTGEEVATEPMNDNDRQLEMETFRLEENGNGRSAETPKPDSGA